MKYSRSKALREAPNQHYGETLKNCIALLKGMCETEAPNTRKSQMDAGERTIQTENKKIAPGTLREVLKEAGILRVKSVHRR